MTKTELDAAVNARLEEIETALAPIPDEQAVEMTALFPVWAPGVAYAAGDRQQYAGDLYRCAQAHTSQAGWEPPNVPALWTEVAAPGVIPVWKQPTGAQDAYQKGDKVHYPDENGPVYVSVVDGNSWPPDVYGWELVPEV